jgi:putative ABC transport system ATP-binding protein
MTKQSGELKTIIDLKGITKRYFIGHPNEFAALSNVSLTIREGEFVSVIGESGSGKSTLMNIIGALDRPTEGQYILDGLDVGEEKDHELSRVRNGKIGFVFQTFNLIPRMNALRNVELPMTYARMPRSKRAKRSDELLRLVGMGDRMTHQPNELSGGQKQRVAIARAMANDPAIILADEPTGALDSVTGHLVMDIFHKLHKEEGKTIVLITHSSDLAAETERIITLRDGEVISERQGSGIEGRGQTS